MANLTTIEHVKRYLFGDESPGDSDDTLSMLVASSSAWVVAHLGQEVMSRTVTETRDGNGRSTMYLDAYPVSSVTSVTVDGDAITARATVDDNGYVLRGSAIDLVGYTFTQGVSNVVIVYTAGAYAVDTTTVPTTPYQYTATVPTYSSTLSVTIAGTAATVTTGVPTTGQYAVSAAGVYTFAAADVGKAVVATYAILPTDIEQATIEHVALRYRDRGRVGLTSESAGGESAAYSSAGTLAYIESVLDSSDHKRWPTA